MAKKLAIGVVVGARDEATAEVRGIVGRVGRIAKAGEQRIGRLTGALTSARTAVVGLATGLIAGKAASLFTDYVNRADEIAKFGRQVGLGAEALQEWRYAADRAGVGSAEFDRGAAQLSRRLGEMRAGIGETATFMKKVAPDVFRQLTESKDVDDALGIAVRALTRLKDPTKRALFASRLFGEELGGRFARFAEAGAEGLQALREEARRYGLVSQAEAEQAEKMSDSLGALKTSIGGVVSIIGAKLVPVLEPLARKWADWIGANRELIGQKVERAIEKIGRFLGDVKDVVGWLVDNLPSVKTMIIGIGLVKLTGLIGQVGQLSSAFGAISLPGGPIALILAGLAAIGVGLKLTIDEFDEAARRARELRRWREGFHEEADRKTDEAFRRAGVDRLKPGETKRTQLLPGEGPRVSTGAQVGRLLGDLSYTNAMHAYADGKLGATEFRAVDDRYSAFHRAPAVAGGTDFLTAMNLLVEDARQAELGLPQSHAGTVEVEVSFKDVPRGAEVSRPRTTGRVRAKTKVGRRLVGEED